MISYDLICSHMFSYCLILSHEFSYCLILSHEFSYDLICYNVSSHVISYDLICTCNANSHNAITCQNLKDPYTGPNMYQIMICMVEAQGPCTGPCDPPSDPPHHAGIFATWVTFEGCSSCRKKLKLWLEFHLQAPSMEVSVDPWL